MRGTGRGAASLVTSLTQYVYDDVPCPFSDNAAAAASADDEDDDTALPSSITFSLLVLLSLLHLILSPPPYILLFKSRNNNYYSIRYVYFCFYLNPSLRRLDLIATRPQQNSQQQCKFYNQPFIILFPTLSLLLTPSPTFSGSFS